MIKKLKFKNPGAARAWVNEIRSNYFGFNFNSTTDRYKFDEITQKVYDFPDRVMEVEVDNRGIGISIDGWSIGTSSGAFLLYEYDILDGMEEVITIPPADLFYVELAELANKYSMEPQTAWHNMFRKRVSQ